MCACVCVYDKCICSYYINNGNEDSIHVEINRNDYSLQVSMLNSVSGHYENLTSGLKPHDAKKSGT